MLPEQACPCCGASWDGTDVQALCVPCRNLGLMVRQLDREREVRQQLIDALIKRHVERHMETDPLRRFIEAGA